MWKRNTARFTSSERSRTPCRHSPSPHSVWPVAQADR
jgi:hypothetical protein